MSTTKYVLGWDIGGAHLKVALVDHHGKVIQAMQLPCALWRGRHELVTAMQQVLKILDVEPVLNVVTMTGELVDLFPNRQTGVIEIKDIVVRILGDKVWFYAGVLGFVSMDKVASSALNIASMN